jgi:ubiquinone biosynthesis protein
MLRSLRTLRSIPRIKDIAFVLGKHGFHQVAGALQAPVSSRLRRVFHWKPPHVIAQPERLRMALEELGPTFIKFGQLLSTRPDLLPPEYLAELGKLQDDVQPTPFEEIRAVIEEDFGASVSLLFRSVDPVPLASASIAQVHRAVTLEGTSVVVKVRKRGLEKIVDQDLRVLGLLSQYLSTWRGFRLFDPEGVVRLFERSIHRELNFEYEKHNVERIRRNLGEASGVRIPRVFAERSSERVLTMEYLEGEKLSLARGRLDPAAGKALATSIALSILKQVFEHGLYHADPHPGNIILMPDGRVGLIDFGNVGRLTPEMVDDLLRLLVAILKRSYPDMAKWILQRGRPRDEIDRSALALELMDTLDPYYGLSLSEIRIGALFNSFFGMVFRHGIAIPAPYALVGRTFVTLEGAVRLCSPGIEILPAIEPYMRDVAKRRWSPERLAGDLRQEVSEVAAAVRSYPTSLAEVLSRAAEGRLKVETRISDLNRIDRRLEQGSSRLQQSILVAGLLVSSAILLLSPMAGREGSLQTLLGGIGFVGCLLLVLKLAVRG